MIPLIVFAETYWALHNQVFEENVHYNSVDQWEFDLFSSRGVGSLPSIQNARAF